MRSRFLALLAGVALIALLPGAAAAARPDPVYRWTIVNAVNTDCDHYRVIGEFSWFGTRVNGIQAVAGSYETWGKVDEVSDVVLTDWKHATRKGSRLVTVDGQFLSGQDLGAVIQPMIRGKIRATAVFVELPACT